MARARKNARPHEDSTAHSRSPRHGHLEARLRRAIQTLLAQGLNDPRIRGLVSVTELDLAPDLGRAVVRVSVLPAEYGNLTVAGLRHAAPRLVGEVARMVRARRIPSLIFELDDRLKRQAAFDALLASNREEIPREA